MSHRTRVLALVFVSFVAIGAAANGGLNFLPGGSEAYDLVISNQLGYDARIRFVGFQSDADFVCDLRDGQSTERDFYAGDRVMCIWDESGELRMTATINVSQNGTLELQNSPTYSAKAYSIRPR